MVEGGAAYHLVYDQVGTLRAVVDSSGNVVKTVEYDSFGNVVADSAPAVKVSFGFAGGLFDIDTGLVRFGFRDYDADVGRWTAKDPIQFAGGDSDLYGYCLGDPVGAFDPDGLKVSMILSDAWFYDHIAISINDVVYSYTDRGGTAVIEVMPHDEYVERISRKRDWAEECVLGMTQSEERRLQDYYDSMLDIAVEVIHRDGFDIYVLPYSFGDFNHNCATTVRAALLHAKNRTPSFLDVYTINWPAFTFYFPLRAGDFTTYYSDIK